MPTVSCYSSDGKVSWQPEAKEHHNVTPHNKLYTRDLLGKKIKEGGYLCSDEKQQRTKQVVGFLGGLWGGQDLPGWPDIGGIV